MYAVRGQEDEHYEIGNQDPSIKPIPAVELRAKGIVELPFDELPNALLLRKRGEGEQGCRDGGQLKVPRRARF
jgi:hypothetical protein